MNFCSRCGAMITCKEEGLLICSCGNRQMPAVFSTTERLDAKKEVDIVEQKVHPLATYDHVCSKCGFGKAQLVSKGHWYGDEDELVEYICGMCGNHDKEDGIRAK